MKRGPAMQDEEKDSSSDEKEKVSSGSKEKETSWLKALLEDQKMHGMVVILGVGLAVLIAFITFSLFSTPPHTSHIRHRPAVLTSGREYTIRPRHYDDDNKPAGARRTKSTGTDEDYDDKRRKQAQAAAKVLRRKAPRRSRKNTPPPAEEEDGARRTKDTATHEDHDDKRRKQAQAAAQVLSRKAPRRSRKNTPPPAEEEDGGREVNHKQKFDAGHASVRRTKDTGTDEDYDDKRRKQAQASAKVLSRRAPRRSRKITPPPAEAEDGKHFSPQRERGREVKHKQKFDAGHASELKSSALDPTDTLPEHPVVCIVNSQAAIEVTYPQDGLCDAVIFNKIFYHSGQLSVGKSDNHSYVEFLKVAKGSRLSAYMVATDRHFNLYEYVPAAPSLDALRKNHHVRGFGYLGIRIQSSQGEMLRQHTRLLRNQVEDLNSMLKEMEVPDSALFLGVTSEEHLFYDDIATAAFKSIVTTVQVHLLIIENHQLKQDDCLGSPITTWDNATGIAFDEAQATASWMTKTGMRPPSPHTAIAFSSWIPAMQFLRSADTTLRLKNGTRRCFVFSLTPYDLMMCSQPRRYHNVSDMYFAKEESMAGVYVYDNVEILENKVYNVRRAMNATTKNVGWAFFGLEYEREDSGQCGHRYDRITAVKKALRAVRAIRAGVRRRT